MKYTKVFMTKEANKQMLLGKSVEGTLTRNDGDIEITVGNYRITMLNYPFVLVKPAN